MGSTPGQWAISSQASSLRSRCEWHSQNQSPHLFRLIQLDEVSSTRDEEELGLRKELMERPGDTAIQGIIGVAEDNPDRALELPQPGDLFETSRSTPPGDLPALSRFALES